MAKRSTVNDTSMLQMALRGFEMERQKIEERIKELRSQLGRRRVEVGAAAVETPRKRNLSPAARRRIALAQKRRWAEHRRKKAAQTKGESREA